MIITGAVNQCSIAWCEKSLRPKYSAFAIGLALIFVALVFPADSKSFGFGEQNLEDEVPILGEMDEEVLVEIEEGASLDISAADWLDSFFDDGPTQLEKNETRATLKFNYFYTENDSFEFKPELNIRLQLPRFEKINLAIYAAEDEYFDIDGNQTVKPGENKSDRGELQAAIRYFFEEGEQYNISTAVGGSYDFLFAGINFRLLQDFGGWQGRFTNRLRWYTDDGFENRASYNIELQFTEKWLFRSTTSVVWQEESDGLFHSQFFRVYQVLDDKQAMQYQLGALFDTEPNYLMSDFQIRVRYRKRFYQEWLFFEIAPQITFPEEHDREINPGITLRLVADFGYTANSKAFERIFSFDN